jgi:hypothetical protein
MQSVPRHNQQVGRPISLIVSKKILHIPKSLYLDFSLEIPFETTEENLTLARFQAVNH